MTEAAPKPNDKLLDNDPRVTYRRTLTIESLCLRADGTLEKVAARERPGSQLVRISAARIFASGKPRRSGFTLLPAEPLEPRVAALLGKDILLNRGSAARTVGPGCDRQVRARLDQVDGIMVYATLLEDDPWATVAPFKAGEAGAWHGLSFIGSAAPSL